MKKVIAILVVMMVLVGAAFAASGDKLSLKSVVGEVLPVFEIRSTSGTGTAGTAAGAEVLTNKDISTGDISWTFYIMQAGEKDKAGTDVTFAKTKKTATLTVSLGHFTGSEATADDNPVFTAFEAADPAGDNADVAAAKKTVITVPSSDELGVSSVSVTAQYKGVNWADQEIAHFTAKWTKDNTLPMDDYYADVTLAYSGL